MKKIKTFFVNLISSIDSKSVTEAISNIAESKLDTVVQDLHDSNIDDYKAAMAGASAFIKHIQPLVIKTPNTIDDIILADLQEVVTKSMEKNNVTL